MIFEKHLIYKVLLFDSYREEQSTTTKIIFFYMKTDERFSRSLQKVTQNVGSGVDRKPSFFPWLNVKLLIFYSIRVTINWIQLKLDNTEFNCDDSKIILSFEYSWVLPQIYVARSIRFSLKNDYRIRCSNSYCCRSQLLKTIWVFA